MITTPTLFILGAGASVPFGYPTGARLRDTICNGDDKELIIKVLESTGTPETVAKDTVEDFINQFSKSSVYSIDAFLEERVEFMDLGKMFIAAALIKLENDEALRNMTGNWYMYLFNRLKSTFDDFDKNNISFITFNYDRSLEQFFSEALVNRYNQHKEHVLEKLKKISIIHLYGKLDNLPWQRTMDTEPMYPYSNRKDNNYYRINNSKSNIQLISSEREAEENEIFKQAQSLIIKSKVIYFLGFGFDKINLDRLNPTLMDSKKIFFTSKGIEDSKMEWLEGYFKKKAPNSILKSNPYSALEFLKVYLKFEELEN